MKAATAPLTAPGLSYRDEASQIQNSGTPKPIRQAPSRLRAVEPVPTSALRIAYHLVNPVPEFR